MPQSAFAARKAAVEEQAKNEPTVVSPLEGNPIAGIVEEGSQLRNGSLKSRRKRRKIIDDSITASQISTRTHRLNIEKQFVQTTSVEVKPLTHDSVEHHPRSGALEVESHALVLTSGLISESTASLNHQEYKVVWSDSYRDADIELPAGQSLAVVGEYDLWLRKGSISVLGATIHSSSILYRIYAPQTHAIPLIKALTNPFGTSLQIADFRLCSADSGIHQLRNCNSRFSRIWSREQGTMASFHINHDETNPHPIFSTPEDWQQQAIKALEHETPPVVMICGPKNAGKSSFARYLSNSFLSRKYAESGVAYLDLDPGQPEYAAPGDLSLIHVKTFNLGPPFTHPRVSEDLSNLLIRQHHFGHFSPREDLEHYLDCASDLFNHYRQTFQQVGCPLVINTSGWIHGLGLESILSLAKHTLPSHMIYFASSEIDEETRFGVQRSVANLGCDFVFLPTENYPPGPRSAADLRSMQFSSYFHLDTPEYRQCRWNSELLSTSKPIALPYNGEEKVISGVLLLGDQINYDMLETAITKTVVALVAVEKSSFLHKILYKPECIKPRDIDVDDTDIQDSSMEDFEIHDPSSADEALQEEPQYNLSYNRKGIPFLSCDHSVNLPLDPATTWSIGQVLLDDIDTQQKVFHARTSTSLHAMRSCLEQGVSFLLVRGQLGMPEWAYLEEYCLSRAIQEDLTELQDFDGRKETDRTSSFDLKEWAQGVEYVEYQDSQGMGGLNKVRRIRRNLGTTGVKA